MLSIFSCLKVFWLCLEQVICLTHGTAHEVVSFNFLLDDKFLDIVTVTHLFFPCLTVLAHGRNIVNLDEMGGRKIILYFLYI